MEANPDMLVARSEQTVAESFSTRGTKRGFMRSRARDWYDFQDYWHDSVASSSIIHGSSVFDAWLLAAAAQVGQVIVTLPYSFSQMGYAGGIIFMLIYGTLGCWSVFLLTWLYFQVKARLINENNPMHERHIMQYHEVMGLVAGVWYGRVTFFFNIGALTLASVIQMIASASDLYYLNPNLDKQKWTVVVGVVGIISLFLPSYRQFRVGAFLAVLGTTVTAVYLTAASLKNGQVPGVKHTAPTSSVKFFTGATNILFTYGGHGITVEIMEAMHHPRRFKFVYIFVVMYTLSLTIPSATSVYWAYGDALLQRSNAFSVLPSSGWRSLALVCILVHQLMAFVVFIHPVYLVVEKITRVHTRNFGLRILVRLPVLALVWFAAIAIPFFGPINSVMGALLVSIGVYVIPPVVFNRVFRSHEMRNDSIIKIHPRFAEVIWKLIFSINVLVVIWVVVVGFIIGSWASLTTFIRQINTFGFFDKCYQC